MRKTISKHAHGYKTLVTEWENYTHDFSEYTKLRYKDCFYEYEREEESTENKYKNQFKFFLFGYHCSIQLRTKLKSVELIVANLCQKKIQIFSLSKELYFDHGEKVYAIQGSIHDHDDVSMLILNTLENIIINNQTPA